MQQLYKSQHLRAKGNLGYLDFIRLVAKIWGDSHPDVPLIAQSSRADAQYPVIMYRQDLKRPLTNEPKPRLRETIPTSDGDDAILIYGQRFQSSVVFTAVTQMDPHVAEELIEVFENFMIEFQPVFKELGVSELVYLRRLPDSSDMRPGPGVVERSVSYLLTTEKIVKTTQKKLESVMIDARVWLDQPVVFSSATPNTADIDLHITDTFSQATPNA